MEENIGTSWDLEYWPGWEYSIITSGSLLVSCSCSEFDSSSASARSNFPWNQNKNLSRISGGKLRKYLVLHRLLLQHTELGPVGLLAGGGGPAGPAAPEGVKSVVVTELAGRSDCGALRPAVPQSSVLWTIRQNKFPSEMICLNPIRGCCVSTNILLE